MSIERSIINAPTQESFKDDSLELWLGERDVMLFFFGNERINGLYEETNRGLAAQELFDTWVSIRRIDYMIEINRQS